MAEPQQDLNFNQYSVLIQSIGTLREELRANNQQVAKVLEDHEDRLRRTETLQADNKQILITLADHEQRLRRNELLVVVSVFAFAFALVITFVVLHG